MGGWRISSGRVAGLPRRHVSLLVLLRVLARWRVALLRVLARRWILPRGVLAWSGCLLGVALLLRRASLLSPVRLLRDSAHRLGVSGRSSPGPRSTRSTGRARLRRVDGGLGLWHGELRRVRRWRGLELWWGYTFRRLARRRRGIGRSGRFTGRALRVAARLVRVVVHCSYLPPN